MLLTYEENTKASGNVLFLLIYIALAETMYFIPQFCISPLRSKTS